MRILFLMRNHGYISHYASTLGLLAERGHRVFIGSRGAERHYSVDMEASMERLCRAHPSISVHKLPRRQDEWTALAETVRSVRNYCRYLHPRYASAHKLRARAAAQVAKVAGWTRVPRTRMGGAVLAAAARAIERHIPVDPSIEAAIAELSPDVVVVTPLVDFNSYQPDYVEAAGRLGIPAVWCVASWDNLSNKGIVGRIPDRVLVWNEPQRREAIELQGVPADRVVTTGAQTFDPWFALSPGTSPSEFRNLVGLPPGPFLLYLCSSLFVAPDEVSFVRRWLSRVRESGSEALEGCGVLVRPHPGNAAQWADATLDELGPVAIWPRAGDLPLESDAKQRYFDSLFHCAAIVGINSSGMIEGGIVGRRSFTLLAPEFSDTQRGTVHFEHLTRGGFLTAATSWDEHLSQLDAVLRDGVIDEDERRRMIAFVRPGGAADVATPRVASSIEGAAALTVTRRRSTWLSSVMAKLLAPLARRASASHAAARVARAASRVQAAPRRSS
jgi:hypothetical protein